MGIGEINRTAADKSVSPEVDQTLARIRALGISAPLGVPFACVFVGHSHSAWLHQSDKGFWQYRCARVERSFGLAEVRAFVGYGELRHVSGVEAARWRERLNYEARLLIPRVVPDLPTGLSKSARRAGDGWRLLVALRDETRWRSQPLPFARRFVMAYCGLSDEQARRGVRELERAGVLLRTDQKSGRALLWRPGWPEPAR